MTPKKVLVIGAGDATGGAITRRFAREGLVACPVRTEHRLNSVGWKGGAGR